MAIQFGAVYSEQLSNSHLSNLTMNTNIVTKSALATAALLGLGAVALTNVHADILTLLGMVVSYGAAVVILAIAASDTNRTKRLH